MSLGTNLLKWLRNSLGVVLLPLVILVVYHHLRDLNWQAVGESVTVLLESRAILALILIVVDFTVLAGYDALAIHHLKVRLSLWKILTTAFIAFAVNFNLGAFFGAGLRYRLYLLWGLRPAVIGQVVVLVVITNWFGFAVLTGLVFTFASPLDANRWVSAGMLQMVGIIYLGFSVGYYLLSSAVKKGFRIGRWQLPLLDHTFLWAQLVLAVSHWMLVSGVFYLLWAEFATITYLQVLAAYLFAAFAGVVLRVPAGLGVMEAVFVEIFGDIIAKEAVVAGVFAFRILYQLLPLVIAMLLYSMIEFVGRGKRPGPAE